MDQSPLLSSEAAPSCGPLGCFAFICFVAAFFTYGLSLALLGAVAIVRDLYRAGTRKERTAAIEAERKRCSQMTCRICGRVWMASDWDAIHTREGSP